MPVRPLDIQVNVNSTVHLSQREISRLSQIAAAQMEMIDKQNKDNLKSDNRVNAFEKTEKPGKLKNDKVDPNQNSSQKDQSKDSYQENKKNARSGGLDKPSGEGISEETLNPLNQRPGSTPTLDVLA